MQTAADNIVEPHNYSVVLTYKAKKGTWPAMRGQMRCACRDIQPPCP